MTISDFELGNRLGDLKAKIASANEKIDAQGKSFDGQLERIRGWQSTMQQKIDTIWGSNGWRERGKQAGFGVAGGGAGAIVWQIFQAILERVGG